jgi:DNA adenine methylase
MAGLAVLPAAVDLRGHCPPVMDQERLAAALKALHGRFILTLNDVPEVRQLYRWARLKAVTLTYTASGAGTPARELIIRPKEQ